MKIFIDFHHAGLARSLVMLLSYRLGHKVYFPGVDMIKKYASNGVWLFAGPKWFENIGGIPLERYRQWSNWSNVVSEEEFFATAWDAVIITRRETMDILRDLLAKHSQKHRIRIIGQAGNDATQYDWDFVPNFMSSDYISYEYAPARKVHKIFYCQELGWQYWDSPYEPITEDTICNVGCFINCWPTFNFDWNYFHDPIYSVGRCPHCGQTLSMKPMKAIPNAAWMQAEAELNGNGYKFYSFGIGCKDGMISEKDLLSKYQQMACVVHMKTYEGYGHSLLQALAIGRPVIVPKNFFRYRTAGRFLIPDITCIEIERTKEDLVEAIERLTDDVAEANERGQACCKMVRSLMDWNYEAKRIKRFLEELR